MYIPEPCWALWQPHSLKTELKTTGAPAWKHLQNSHMLGKKRPFLRTVPFHPWTHTKEPLVPTASDTGQLSQRNEPTRASLQNSRQLLHPFFLAPGKNEQPCVLLEAICRSLKCRALRGSNASTSLQEANSSSPRDPSVERKGNGAGKRGEGKKQFSTEFSNFLKEESDL